MPFLREAANNLDDPDFAAKPHQCLEGIEGSHAAAVSMAVVRSVAALKPDGAADALLQYLPYAENDKAAQEVETALAAVALNKDGKPESAVVRALTDATPVRRAAAAVALCRVGGDEQKAAVLRLLKDPKPTVRFLRLSALADAYQGDAVPVLIDLLADLPNEQRTGRGLAVGLVVLKSVRLSQQIHVAHSIGSRQLTSAAARWIPRRNARMSGRFDSAISINCASGGGGGEWLRIDSRSSNFAADPGGRFKNAARAWRDLRWFASALRKAIWVVRN